MPGGGGMGTAVDQPQRCSEMMDVEAMKATLGPVN